MTLADILFDKKIYNKDVCIKYLNNFGYKPIDKVSETDIFYSYKISHENESYEYKVIGGDHGVFFNVGFLKSS